MRMRCDWTPAAASRPEKTLHGSTGDNREEPPHQFNMKKGALWFLIFTGLFNVTLGIIFARNVYVDSKKTWSEARAYCRENHIDLTTIRNQEEERQLHHIEGVKQGKTWIDLHFDNYLWSWSAGEQPLFFNWSASINPMALPIDSQERICVAQGRNGWEPLSCERESLRFFCFESSLVLVKEEKTWEEAVEHCRQEHTDLVSLFSESATAEVLPITTGAQTDHVWTGLRYLGDGWLWVNGDMMEHQAWSDGQAPRYSAGTHRCGTLSLTTRRWDSRDCADKLNFICY